MPNAKQHAIIGAAVAGGLCLATELLTAYLTKDESDPRSILQRVSWGNVAAFAAVGGAIALLPDILEPAVSPHHRQFFHSLAMIGLTGYGILGEHTKQWSPRSRNDATICAAAYLSHLMADGLTPKGLPWV